MSPKRRSIYLGNKLDTDLGFGTKLNTQGERLINKDGSFNVIRHGHRTWTPYQSLIEIHWFNFLFLVSLSFGLITLLFAGLFFWVGPAEFNGVSAERSWRAFWELFFLSVQTFTTVGYGYMSPKGMLANMVASIEAFTGAIVIAMATALFFARLARPKAKILFSSKAIIGPYRNGYGFLFRIANLRNNRIINLEAKLTLSWIEQEDGNLRRRFANLDLEREKVNLFPLNWTIVHPIEDTSPLSGLSPAEIRAVQPEFIILIGGFDETFAQNVHATSSYTAADLVFDAQFGPMFYQDARGHMVLELNKIDDYQLLSTGVKAVK